MRVNVFEKILSKAVVALGQTTQKRIYTSYKDISVPDFEPYRRESTKIYSKRPPSRGNEFKRKSFTYGVGAGLLVGSLYLAKATAHGLVKSMAASADVLALAQIEVDLTQIAEGENATFKWRGKPLFILHRTPADIEREKAVPVSSLRDPATDGERCERPEWLIVIGVCTHLGCVPIAHAGDFGGYYCPCHGSHFDAAGRVRKGPAPLNLAIPDYKFNENSVLVG